MSIFMMNSFLCITFFDCLGEKAKTLIAQGEVIGRVNSRYGLLAPFLDEVEPW